MMKAAGGLFFLSLLFLFSRVRSELFTPGENQACNAGLLDKPCVSWDAKGFDTNLLVVIDCGDCVELVETVDINLPHGLDVRGRLRVAPPSDQIVSLTLPFLLVQGVLSIDTPYAPGANETVRITMTGDNGDNDHYTGFGDNAGACGGSCPLGKRGIVVGGGRLDVTGLPKNCATWKPLLSVTTGSVKQMDGATDNTTLLPANCDLTLYQEDFEGTFTNWYGEEGAPFYARTNTSNQYLEVVNRIRPSQGLAFNLDDTILECATPNVPYLYSFRLKLNSDAPTQCDKNGNQCLYVGYNRRACGTSDCPNVHKGLQRVNRGFLTGPDNMWYTVTGQITLDPDDLAPNQYYRYIYMDSVEPGVDIAIDDFRITRLGSGYFPTENVCDDLAVNGKASLDPISPYPLVPTDGASALLVMQDADGNHFFRLTNRRFNWSSVRMPIDHGKVCLEEEAVYRVSFRTRADKALTFVSRLWYYFDDEEGNRQYRAPTIASSCTTGVDVFAECVGEIAFNNPEYFLPSTKLFVDQVFHSDSNTVVDFDDFSMTFASGPAGSFVVEADGVENCWLPGSKVLLTSDTMYYEDDTLATIKTVTPKGDDGTVELVFEEPLSPRLAGQYPIELALMERNILFRSDSDALSEGGHLAVWMTPGVQLLDGVELYKFGQQGILGRYPVHWHLCGSVEPHTVARRNLIRDSNQRCFVIHGTHNLTLSENVVRENFGHCFLLEDGVERDNSILYNLATRSKHLRIDPPLRGGIDDDSHASTYWITNPQNTYVGNVAAGGDGSGFWYELEEVKSPSVRDFPLHPSQLPLTRFENNTAHSYRSTGFRVYPHGYRPRERQWFVNTNVYKNHWDGMFFHNSWRLGARGGVVADNRRGINIDQADDIVIRDVDIVGETGEHRVALTRAGRAGHCPHPVVSKWGIKIHAYLFQQETGKVGPTIDNVRFYNVSDNSTGCTNTAAMFIDSTVTRPKFNDWTTISGVSMSSVSTEFEACDVVDKGVKDIVIEIDGDTMYGSSGYLVSRNQSELTAFLPADSCTDRPEACLLFCSGACFRTLQFLVEPDISIDMKLRVKDTASGKDAEFDEASINRGRFGDGDSTNWGAHRMFIAHLPPGDYEISFVLGTSVTWPTYVLNDHLPEPNCMSGQSVTYTLEEPTPSSCDTLISSTVKNGNFEADGGSIKYWKHPWSGVELDSSNGYGSSNSGVTKIPERAQIGQSLDTRCLTAGSTFDITGRMLPFDAAGTTSYPCDPNTGNCRAILYFQYPDETTGEAVPNYWHVASAIDSTDTSDWTLVQGLLTVDDALAKSNRAILYFMGGTQYGHLDDATVVSLARSPGAVILNGDFETGDYRYWTKNGPTLMETPGADGTATAVRITKPGGTIYQRLDSGTLTAGTRYLFTAKYKLVGGAGTCDPNLWWGATACPKLMIYSAFKTDTDRNEWKGFLYSVAPVKQAGDWNDMWGYVIITEAQATADHVVRFEIGAGPTDAELVVDQVTMTQVTPSCDSLVVNGGAESGDARGWMRFHRGEMGIDPNGSDGAALVIRKRLHSWLGMVQDLDVSCMVAGNTYTVKAKFKLEDETTGQPHACVAGTKWGDDACPRITFVGYQTGQPNKNVDVFNTLTSTPWVADGFNDFEGEITIPQEFVESNLLQIYNQGPPGKISIIMDELTVTLKAS